MPADPERGIVYIPTNPPTVDFFGAMVVANRGDLRGPQGLPIWKPSYGSIAAIDMSTVVQIMGQTYPGSLVALRLP